MKSSSYSNPVNEAIAGFIAGASSTLLLHPLDLLKIRIQVDVNRQGEALLGRMNRAFRKILYNSGSGTARISNMWIGVTPNLAGAAAAWGLYFYFYDYLKATIRQRYYSANSNEKLPAYLHLSASAAAGALTCTITNPIWVVKTRMCTQDVNSPHRYKGLFEALWRISRTEGLAGLYSGYVPALFGVSHGAVQFMIYEELKKHSTGQSALEYIYLAATSKIVASFVTYPYQVIKSRLQSQSSLNKVYNGTWDAIVQTWRTESVYGFYRGLGPNLIRVLPGTCVTFGIYEALSGWFKYSGEVCESVSISESIEET